MNAVLLVVEYYMYYCFGESQCCYDNNAQEGYFMSAKPE